MMMQCPQFYELFLHDVLIMCKELIQLGSLVLGIIYQNSVFHLENALG